MKSSTILISILFTAVATQALAKSKNLKEDFETLGDNEAVVERVRNLDNRQKVRVVQNRLVDRNHRVELSMNMGGQTGGDSYVQTQTTGGSLQYHISPRWSLGVDYQRSFNSLTSEGKRVYDKAQQELQADPSSSPTFPEVDYARETTLATVSFYPIYGKLNLFDLSIAQFDIYTLLGYGQKKLSSGNSDVFAAGLGSGIWLNRWLTARLEVRYEKYQDLLLTEVRDQNAVSAMASVGILVW